MQEYSFNVNNYVFVKLTDFGKQKIIKKNGFGYFEHCVESYKRPDGYYALQMHEVMNLLGEYCYNGTRELPFDLNIRFSAEDLKEVDNEG